MALWMWTRLLTTTDILIPRTLGIFAEPFVDNLFNNDPIVNIPRGQGIILRMCAQFVLQLFAIAYHPAKKDGILNSWWIFYAIRWHNIFKIPPLWNILCHPDAWHIRKIHRECRNCRTQNHTRKNRIFSPCPGAFQCTWGALMATLTTLVHVRHMPLPSPSQCSKSQIAVLGGVNRRYTSHKMWSEPL